MNVLETLKAVRRRLEKPEAWTKGSNARDEDGLSRDPSSPKAVCWCLNGAIWRESTVRGFTLLADRDRVRDALGFRMYTDVAEWNDEEYRTHAEVLARIDQAIEKVSREAQ